MELEPVAFDALQAVLAGHNCLITGQAGTGKSTLIRCITECIQRNHVVVSTTGIATLNLVNVGVSCSTLHSALCIMDGRLTVQESLDLLEGEREPFHSRGKLLKEATLIIIEEVSMMSRTVFEKVCIAVI